MESILTSIKKLLGIADEYTHFDSDIIIFVNTVFSTLSQLGVGPVGGFIITDEYALWSDYTDNSEQLALVKTYVFMKTKMMFDPPVSSAVLSAMERQISELEWRLHIISDTTGSSGSDEVGTIIVEWGE